MRIMHPRGNHTVVIVEISEDRMGNLLIDLQNQRLRAQFVKRAVDHILDVHAERTCRDGMVTAIQRGPLVFLQEGFRAQSEAIEDLRLTKRDMSEIGSGWTVRKKVDIETFDHWFCWSNQLSDGE